MQTIEVFNIPDVPECSVELPAGLKLIDADVDNVDHIEVYYMDERASDQTVTITWYVLKLGMEVGDNFPGQFFKRVTLHSGANRFIFFKQDAKKRKPIVVEVPKKDAA